jgi:hypothetical protein
MKKMMTLTRRKRGCFIAAVTFTVLLLASSPASAQYMSFFGDSTWKYQYTLITRPPEDYLDYPLETPNALGVYCITSSACFRKDNTINQHLLPYSPQYCDQYRSELCQEYEGELHPDVWKGRGRLYEDTLQGHLIDGGHLICDMSLSEGDTFLLEGMCSFWYPGWLWMDNPIIWI